MQITITYGGGYTIISDGTSAGTMRYMDYGLREAIALYRKKYGLQGKRLTIIK